MSLTIPPNVIDLEGIEAGDAAATSQGIGVIVEALNLLLARQRPITTVSANPIIKTIADTGVNFGQVGAFTGNPYSGPGIDFAAGGNSIDEWAIANGSDSRLYGSLVFIDKTTNQNVLGVYRTDFTPSYAFAPAAQHTIYTIDLGVNNSAGRWSSVFANGYYERGRTVPMGEWIQVAYDGANFTADAGLWDVGSGDQTTYRYTLIGKTMILAFCIQNTTLNATPTAMILKIPGGFTPAATLIDPFSYSDNGTFGTGQAIVSVAGGGFVYFYTATTGPWQNAANTTEVRGQIAFEVA